MSIETFDWQGYMSDIGYAPEEIPNEINDEDREWLYGLWARDLMEQLNYEAKQNPFLSTSKEKANEARRQFLEYAPDLAHLFGEEVQPNNPNATFDPEEFRQHVVNNEVQNANLGYYLDTFAASRINEDTDVKWPWLKGLTKDQFKKSFMEQQDIDEAWTSVDDIRNGNFGTLAANYQAQLAQQQGGKGDGKSGHMAALKQGWYEFEKLFGYTAGTLGDATGIQWLSDIGNEIAQNVIQKSDAYNYQSKYNQSLADTIKNEGVMAAGGKILNMAEENWATTAAPLALAAIGKILSTYAHVPQPLADAATRAVAANVVRRQGANLLRRASQLAYGSSAALSGLEIGGVRAELEEKGKYDPNNVADVVAAGLVSSSLDFIGNVAAMKGLTITTGRLWRSNLATMEARSRLAKEIAEDQAKSFTHRVLSAMATEGVTEGLQEIPAMVVGARRGVEYTSKEVRDRIIDAAAVGAFMGGGIRAGEIALEKYHRGDEESPTDTDADETPETPDAPEAPPQPSQPPPPDFDGEMPFNNVTYRQMENGFVAADPFNVGYGATRNEAAEDFLKNANKGRVDIDANDIRSVPSSATGEGSSIVRYGNNGEHSVRIIGQGSNALIRKIIDIHNNPKNAVNLQGHNTFNASDFQSTNPDLNEDQFIRSVLEQKKTGRGSNNDVIANRKNAVDIPVNLTAVPRTNIAGSYAAFNLDQDTRDALRDKGFTILSNPKSRENGRIQKLLLYRDGFVYTVTLRNSVTDDNVSAVVEAEHIKDINARRQITNKDQNKKARNENIKRNSLEAGVRNQTLRVVTTDPVTDIRSISERKSSITIAPVLRAGFVELNRKVNAEGVEEFTIDPRKILEKRIKDANGKIEKIGARGITYTTGGETTRLDITADGRVVVSTDGRFVGDYEFFDPADLTEGERRASFQSTRIEATQPFNVIDIPEELQFNGRVTFVYEGDANTPENQRNYYAIRNNGDVYYLSPADENYVKRLLKLQYIQNLNDARDVFGNQFIEFYALPSFYEDGDVNHFVGFKTENNLLPVVNLEDPTLHRFSNMEVDDLISAGYNGEFVKVYAIIAPNGEVVRATTEEGVDAFIEDIKGYANILDDSEWNPSSRRESIFGDAYIERGLYREDDIYGRLYSAAEIYVNDDGTPFTDEDFNRDSDEIRETTRRIVQRIKETVSNLRNTNFNKNILDEFEFHANELGRKFTFFDNYTSQQASQYFSSAREFNRNVREILYRARIAQALLHIDLHLNKLGSIVNESELNSLIDQVGTYQYSDTMEQLRERAVQVESIALRLEEAHVDFMRSSQPTQTTDVFWEAIYPSSTGYNYGSFVNRIHSEGTDFRFSRAAETPRVRRKDSILNELQKELGDFTLDTMLEKGLRGESGGLVILPDQEAAHNIERMFTTDATQPYYDDEGLIQGFVAPDGMIYLVEDGIVDGKARQIILHEYGVHARKFGMTDAQFQEVVQNIKAKRDEKSAEGDFVRHAITRAKRANKNMSEDNPIFWEEVAAYAVEDGYHLADTGIVGRMQTWMKNWLWRFGVIDATAFHYQDFVNMAQGMLGNPGPLSFFDGTHDYTKYQDSWKNIPKFSRTILAEDTPDREEFAQRTYRRLRGLDDAIDRERNGEDADSIEQVTDWRRNDQGDWGIRYSRISVEGARRLDISDPRGLTTRMMEYDLAVQMEAEGKSEAEIKALTNWTRGNDGLWGYEVVDKDMTFEIPGLAPLEEELNQLNVPQGELKSLLRDRIKNDIREKYYPNSGRNFGGYLIIGSLERSLDNFRDAFEGKEVALSYDREKSIENFGDPLRSGKNEILEGLYQYRRAIGKTYTNWIGIRQTIREGSYTDSYSAGTNVFEKLDSLITFLESNDHLTDEQFFARFEQEIMKLRDYLKEIDDKITREEFEIFVLDKEKRFTRELEKFVADNSKKIESLKERIKSLKKGHQGKLSNVVSHPELFHAYPELEDVQLEFKVMFPGVAGYMEETTREGASKRHFRIVINSLLDTEQMKSTALHEMQHVIQALSGFASGGNTAMFRDADLLRRTRYLKLQGRIEDLQMKRVLSKIVTRDNVLDFVTSDLYENELATTGKFARFSDEFYIKGQAVNGVGQFVDVLLNGQFAPSLSDHLGGTFYGYLKETHPDLLKEVERDYNEAQQRKLKADNEYRELTDEPFQKYRRLMGELEARVTQRRMNMTEEEMRETPISETEREFEGIEKEELIDPRDLKEVVNGEPGGESELRYSRATAEELKPYSSFISTLENDLVSQRISGVPNEGDTVLYQRGDVNEFITRDSLYTIEDADDYYPDLEQRWIDYHRDDSESNFVRYSRSIPETNGFRYSFAGEIGAAALDAYEKVTTRMDNLVIARQMEEAGKDAKAIKYATGWERGADNKWRYEIDDSVAIFDVSGDAYYVRTRGEKYVKVRNRIRELKGKKRKKKAEKEELERLYEDNSAWAFHLDFLDVERENNELKLYNFLQHRELYDAYPQLEDIKVRLADLPDRRRAHYVPGANLIELNKNLIDIPEEAFGVLLHEVQHVIQKIEGFSRGGSVDEFKDENKFRRFTELVNEMVDTKRNYRDLVRNFVVKNARRYIEEWNEFQVNENGEFSEPYNLDGKDINNLYELGYIVTDYMIENDINPNTNLSDIIHGADLVLHDFFEKEGFYKNIPTDFDEILEQYKLQEAELSLVSQEPEDIYRRLAGEVEARNVKHRLNMILKRAIPPLLAKDSEDVAREDQIILENMLNEASSAIRYSRAATIDDVPQTPRQRGTQVPNAPGMYKMPDGSLHIEPSELPVGFESETILYAAIAISDPAKEEPKIAELRGLILTDPDLMRETDRMMRERNDTNEDHRLGYAASLILEAYDPTSDIYQQTVDAFHEAVSKATGGAYQNLILDTGQIEAAAHAAAGIPYEALLTAPQETVPTPRQDAAEVQRQELQDAFDNSDAQREYMQVGEDGRAFISTDDSDVDVIFESKVTNPFDTGRLTDDVLLGTTEHTESEDFYNHLADSPHHGTQEPLDTGGFTRRADTIRSEVESFLANVLPEHIWNRMEILWEDNAENRKVLDNALGKFSPKAWQNKNIVIRGWNRTFGQVVRTAAREASRFGWNLWQNRDFRKALTDFYDMFSARMYEELRPYYNQMGVTDPTKLTNGQKIFMVQTFFSKLNQSLFTDDQGNMADILGIDAQEYRSILSNVRRGISAQENDLTPFMRGLAGDTELAKQFAQEMLRMTMETATNIGTHFVYERANTLGGKDKIHVYTNEWGTWRRPIANTRFGKVAAQIKENLEWWNDRWKGSPRAERFARWMMRNLPMGFKGMKLFHLYVPDARLGDTTLGKASQLISRVWQRIGDMSGTTIPQDYALMEEIHDILRDHGYDPLVANDMVDQNPNQTYVQFFQSLGITSAKAMEKARLADEVVRTSRQLKKEQAANIRSMIVETGVSLYNRMVNAGVSERYIRRMVNDFENKRQKFHDNYSHRMYEAFTPEGKSELSRMLHYLKRDPATGELTIAKRARNAEDNIRKAEARYGRGTSQFYKATIEDRKDLRRYERLMHLWNFEMAVLKEKKRLFGAELNEAIVTAMKNTIKTIVVDSQSVGRIDAQAVPHYNSISAQKVRKLDPSKAHHRELMAFLSEIKDPMRVAVYSADQQRQIIAKLQFNKELGEYLVDNNMADIRGIPNSEGIARDLAQMESGTFLEYINVDPEFMPEIKAEWENMQKVTETVLGGVTDAVKANSTVYSLRLAMNNYIGNFSMLLASGHFWRFGQWMNASDIVRKQFLDRFTYGAKDPSDFGKLIIKEMEAAMVTGGSGTEMSVFQLNKNAHENFVQMMTGLLYGKNLISRGKKFKIDNFVKKSLEYARKFYTYGDEWVKPLMYINNRMNAIAKYEAILKRENGETEEDYKERVLKKAIEEASEMTIRETVSWENSPFMVRQLSTKSVRFFVPDFLLHNFQMLRITASNYVRLAEIWKELRSFNPTDMNPDKVADYRSALVKEFAQRSVGGAMTAGVYAGLAGATGSCMAFIPYMMNTLMAAIDGEDDKDKDNTFFNPQQWEGAQRILNYKTGGDNFFVPAWKHNGKIYAWNYGRASVMLTHAVPQPATENPEFMDYAAQFFKNIVNIGGGTIAQEIVNNAQGKDKWGRDIGMEAGWGKIIDRVIVPGAVRQLMDMSIGYPGSENPYREGKAIKMSDAVGITVNAYDMRDIVNELGWDMGRIGSNAQNVVRKSFVKRLTKSDELSDSDVASMVSDMREDNARHMDRANYLLTGLRQMGMENKDIQHWLTTSRKDANTILSKKQATAFLKGHNVYDDALVTYLKNRRNNLAKGQDDVRMSKEELAVVLQNYDKAIRIYSQALRAQ